MAKTYWWIKERENPQTGTYYVPCGELSPTEARKKEHTLYGYNIMHRFTSKTDYDRAILRLKKQGKHVH